MGQFSIDRTSLNQNFSLAENLINFTSKCRKPKPTLLLPKRSRAPKGRPKMRSKRLKSKKQKMAPTAQTAKPTPRLMPKLTELMVREKRKRVKVRKTSMTKPKVKKVRKRKMVRARKKTKATINRINRLILKIFCQLQTTIPTKNTLPPQFMIRTKISVFQERLFEVFLKEYFERKKSQEYKSFSFITTALKTAVHHMCVSLKDDFGIRHFSRKFFRHHQQEKKKKTIERRNKKKVVSNYNMT